MTRQIFNILISISDEKNIILDQPGQDSEMRFNTIKLSTDQIDLLCEWLQEAKNELLCPDPPLMKEKNNAKASR